MLEEHIKSGIQYRGRLGGANEGRVLVCALREKSRDDVELVAARPMAVVLHRGGHTEEFNQ